MTITIDNTNGQWAIFILVITITISITHTIIITITISIKISHYNLHLWFTVYSLTLVINLRV